MADAGGPDAVSLRNDRRWVEFRVRVHNEGAGHKIPTGLTEVREMWLDVTVADARERILLHSGEVGKNGEIDPAAAIFRTILETGGREVKIGCCLHEFPEEGGAVPAEKVARDRRILPKGYEEERYSLPLPADVAIPVTVKARLKYRSMSQAFSDQFLGEESAPVPVILMAEETRRLDPP